MQGSQQPEPGIFQQRTRRTSRSHSKDRKQRQLNEGLWGLSTLSSGLCGKLSNSHKGKLSEDRRSDLTPGPEEEGGIRFPCRAPDSRRKALGRCLLCLDACPCGSGCASVPLAACTRELAILLLISKSHRTFQSSFHPNQDSQVAGHTEPPLGQGHRRRRTVLSEGHFEIPMASPHPNPPHGPRTA